MRIAVFHEVDFGGARKSASEFAKGLAKWHDVDYYYVDREKNSHEVDSVRKIYFYKFIPKKWTGHDWKAKLYKDTIEVYKLYRLHKHIGRNIHSRGYDAVFVLPSRYTQTPFLLRFLKIPSVYYCQEYLRIVYEKLYSEELKDFDPIRRKYEKWNRFVRKQIDKNNILHATKILANSKFTKNNIDKAYGIQSTVCYMGVNTKNFKRANKKKEFDILFVGSYEKADGYDLFQSAISLLKQKPKIRELVREKEWISSLEEMRNIYQKSRILLCLGYKEPFGLAPLEASACGVPIIAVDEGGYKESVIHNKNGILVKRNAKDLAQAIEKLLSDSDMQKNFSNNATEHVLNFWDWSVRSAELSSIIQGVVKKSNFSDVKN